MTGKEYRSVIDWTVKKCKERSDEPIETVRAVCKNLGTELPDGDVREISEVLKTNDYMGWRSYNINDAKFCADIGIATIGIDDDKIVILADNADKNNPSMLTKNSTDDIIMTVTDETSALSVGNMQFYSYSYGCGGSGGTGGSCPPGGSGILEEDYIIALRDTFGFSRSTADLIRSLYDKVNKKFPSEGYREKAWKCARLLSVFNYDGWVPVPFNALASSVVSLSDAPNYFICTLGFSILEYNQLKKDIQDQHKTSNPDFVHMQYSLAARLAYMLDKDLPLSNIYTGMSDEDVSYLAGWFGDAVLTPNGTTTMEDDDYCADLDAENIYRYIIDGKKSIHAFNIYYSELARNGNRAIKFKSYISYDTVQKKVFEYLIDVKLKAQITSASQIRDVKTINELSALLNSEEYHWDTIKKDYPDTYNFLKSLYSGLPHIRNYI